MTRHRLLVAAATLVAGTATAQPTKNTPPDADRVLAREIYREMVEVPSGFSTGSTTPIAEKTAARLVAAGFPAADIFVGGAAPHKHNLVVRYRGTGARKPVLLLAHTDVVEAKREDWSMDPFTFTEKDGYFYGRGVGDDKAQASIWIATLLRFKREGFTPDRDIIVALTADEEGGGPYNGVDWLLKNHRELIDAEFALNEGGWGESEQGTRIVNDVQVAEKYVVNYRLEVKNKGGHSSLPVSDNAITRLSGALYRLGSFGFPLKTNAVTREYFRMMSTLEKGPVARDLALVAKNDPMAMQRVAKARVSWNATLRTTCVATMLEGGHAKNALPQVAAASVNCRVHPDDKVEYVTATLAKVANDTAVHVIVEGTPTAGPVSPLRDDVMGQARSITSEMWPTVQTVPIMVMGATDGKATRAAGIPTYGIMGLFFDRDDVRFHGRDERVRVEAYHEAQTFLYQLVKRLSGGRTGI